MLTFRAVDSIPGYEEEEEVMPKVFHSKLGKSKFLRLTDCHSMFITSGTIWHCSLFRHAMLKDFHAQIGLFARTRKLFDSPNDACFMYRKAYSKSYDEIGYFSLIYVFSEMEKSGQALDYENPGSLEERFKTWAIVVLRGRYHNIG